jgi:hypothetical protein
MPTFFGFRSRLRAGTYSPAGDSFAVAFSRASDADPDTTGARVAYHHLASSVAMSDGRFETALGHARPAISAQHELGFETTMSSQAQANLAL